MRKEIRTDYEQTLMFPPLLEDWISQDHPARFLREFVDSLDLPKLGFRERPSDLGRPNYSSPMFQIGFVPQLDYPDGYSEIRNFLWFHIVRMAFRFRIDTHQKPHSVAEKF